MDGLLGFVSFKPVLYCGADALGHSAELAVGDHCGTLTLPSSPAAAEGDDDANQFALVAPSRAVAWRRESKPLDWGYAWGSPGGDAGVERAVVEFHTHGGNIVDAQHIYEQFGKWFERFMQYVTLLTKQNTRRTVSGGDDDHIELFAVSKERFEHVTKTGPINITVDLSDYDEMLHLDQLHQACRLSSLGTPPRLEYRVMLEAYRARRDGDYRKAIIEAATALEICLTTRASLAFADQGISFGEQLLQKFRMLGGRFELLSMLGIDMPKKDYRRLLVEPRNDVIHRAEFPQQTTANSVIGEVEELLKLFSPELNSAAEMEGVRA